EIPAPVVLQEVDAMPVGLGAWQSPETIAPHVKPLDRIALRAPDVRIVEHACGFGRAFPAESGGGHHDGAPAHDFAVLHAPIDQECAALNPHALRPRHGLEHAKPAAAVAATHLQHLPDVPC